MNNFDLRRYRAMLKREVLEHPTLFFGAPVLEALLIVLILAWLQTFVPLEEKRLAVEYMAVLFNGLSPTDMAPIFMLLAIPFVASLYISAIVYLTNSLYQDRRDTSGLFWQSIPVSILQTVLSKIVTIGVVVPLIYMGTLAIMYCIGAIWLTVMGLSYEVEIAGLGYMFMAALTSLALVYLSTVVASLWLLPTVGWLLLFSAFAKRTPLLWAIGAFILLGLIEGFVFNTQYLANWVESRSDPSGYLILSFGSVFDRLFTYDMLFGIAVGSILITGAVYMRRFID